MTPADHIPKGAEVAWLDRPGEEAGAVDRHSVIEDSRRCLRESKRIVRQAQRLIEDGQKIAKAFG